MLLCPGLLKPHAKTLSHPSPVSGFPGRQIPVLEPIGDQRVLWEIIKERSSNVIRTWVFQWGSWQEMCD